MGRRFDSIVMIASLFRTGYIPFAPGTFGTLVSALFVFLLKPEKDLLLFISGVVFFSGIFISGEAERRLNERDSRHIVIDEFVGYLVSIYGHSLSLPNLFVAFFLFRFFDIIKPFPIKLIERRLRGGFAIMLDDVIAGLMANLSLHLITLLFKTN
jgi:phosphatidylglycerophosphatase A